MEREGNLQSEFEAMYGLRQAESRTKYQRRMIEDQARELEEIYRKLDPQSRSLLKQQSLAIAQRESSIREALVWKELSGATHQRAFQAESNNRHRQISNQIHDLQEQFENETAEIDRAARIEQARHHAEWMISSQELMHAYQKAEAILKSQYDLQSADALADLNRQLSEQHQKMAEQVGEIWKSYYLQIHSAPGPALSIFRRPIDEWLGLKVGRDNQTGIFWRYQPLPNDQLAGFTNRSPSGELQTRLAEIHSIWNSVQDQLRVEFALAIGQARSQRIEELYKASQQRILATNQADELLARATLTTEIHEKRLYENSQAEFIQQKDEIEIRKADQDRSEGITSTLKRNSIERGYQQRIDRSWIDYQRSWADAQGQYHHAIARIDADRLHEASDKDARAQALAAHATGYAQWILDVSPDFTAWVVARAAAQADQSQQDLKAAQDRAIAERVAEESFLDHTDRLKRKTQREKSAVEFEFRLEKMSRSDTTVEDQRRLDLEYRLLVHSHELAYLQAVEDAETKAQVMKIQGRTGFEQAREKSLLMAEARYLQAVSDSQALMDWKDRSVGLTLAESLQNAQQPQLQSLRLNQLDTGLERSVSQLRKSLSDAMAQARFEFQIDHGSTSGRLQMVFADALCNWLSAAAIARIDAREELRQVVLGDWAEFLLRLAESQSESIESSNAEERRLADSHYRADIRYTEKIARAQLEQSEAVSVAEFAFRESEIQQDAGSLETASQAMLDYIAEVQAPALRMVHQINASERLTSNQIALAELEFQRDFDVYKYRQRLEQAKEFHESGFEWIIPQWNQDRLEALADKRAAEAQLERSDRLSQITRESLLAQQMRTARKVLIDKEAEAYRDSELSSVSAYEQYVRNVSDLRIDAAHDIDIELDSAWSQFFLDITQAKESQAQAQAAASELKILAQSRQQVDHEKIQAELQRVADQGGWIASDLARRTVANLDWSVEQVLIQAIRLSARNNHADAGFLTIPQAPSIPRPARTSGDRRYDLVFSQTMSLSSDDPFTWRDTGFLAWIRSPREQFSAPYWALDKSVDRIRELGENSKFQELELAAGSWDPLSHGRDLPTATKTPTQLLIPESPATQQASSRVDPELSFVASQWLDLHGRMLPALQRPDHSDLISPRNLGWELSLPPVPVQTPVQESSKRFFIDDQTQWDELLSYASDSYGAIYGRHTSQRVKDLLDKYRKHVGNDCDGSQSDLLLRCSTARRVAYQDQVIVREGIVYWQHAIGIEPSRIEGNPVIQTSEIPLGQLDRFGWIYLPSGKRVLYSALRKWSDELILGSSDQISTLIDGLISPFTIDIQSKQYGIFIGGTGMHVHKIGNVERLYNLYQGSKFYYGGVGNPTEYDSDWYLHADNGAGYGWAAILDRIEADMLAHYRGHQKIHIFGWSRGAAMAVEFSRRMQRYRIDIEFLGLFDPVYSYVLPGQSSELIQWSPQGRWGNYVGSVPARNVKAIGVIYAANEDRSFFPATQLYPNGISKLKLMKSPGAHGEIGGHFRSNPILQRLNMRAMIEMAAEDGHVEFRYQSIDPDIARILSSPLSGKLQLLGISDPLEQMEIHQKSLFAAKLENWIPMTDEEYYRALIDCTVRKWRPGPYGFQKDQFSGLLAFSLEVANELAPAGSGIAILRDGLIQQSPYTHYPRRLAWCTLELWDVGFLEQEPGRNRLTERQKETIRLFYHLRIDPATGNWIRPIP
jgi:hypothetical protein